ncbi:hypothetical protein [Nocardia sp. NPDC051463]|uniref:hypothetical protein n=1 Tax=Nocardia sp. NPDC051463 TaxID=3154845 RepID=UPI00344C3924
MSDQLPADYERIMDRCDVPPTQMDIERAHGIKVIHVDKKAVPCTPADCPRLKAALEFIKLAGGLQ